MRNLSKKLRFRRNRKKFSLEHNNHGISDKQSEPIHSVVLQNVKFNQDGTSWFQEDMKHNADSRETTPTREDVAFCLPGESESNGTTTEVDGTKVTVGSNSLNTKATEIKEERRQSENWTKDVIFEAEQLILKAEIEKLRNHTDKTSKEQEGTKASKGNYSTNGLQETTLEKCLSLPVITEHDNAASSISDDITSTPIKQRRSTLSKISRKFGKFSLSKSMESLSNEPDNKTRENKSEEDVYVIQEGVDKGHNSMNDLQKWSSLPMIVEPDDSTASGSNINNTTASKQQKRSKKVSRKLGRFTSKSMESLSNHESEGQFNIRESKSERDIHLIQEESMGKAEVDVKDNSTNGSQNQKDESKLEKWSSLPFITEHEYGNSSSTSSDTNTTASKQKKQSAFSKVSRKLGRFTTSKSMESLSSLESDNQFKIRQSKSDRHITLIQEGSMALLRAAKNNSVIQAGSLLSHGISPEILDQRGWTPLCIALEHKNFKCAEVLVRWRANVNFIHEDGTSILHYMTSSGSYNGIKFLLRHGVDVNVEDSKGWPAVHYGLQGNLLKCAALLLAGGVNSEVYTRKRVDEFKAVVRKAAVGKWTHQWQNVLEIDLENQEELNFSFYSIFLLIARLHLFNTSRSFRYVRHQQVNQYLPAKEKKKMM